MYDYILALCVGTRGDLTKPFTNEGWLYSTNSFIAVRMAPDRPLQQYGEGKVKVGEVFTKETDTTDQHKVYMNTAELLGILSQYGMYINMRKNCETCSGTGKLGEEVPTVAFAFTERTIKLDGKSFSPQYLHIVALVAAVLGDRELTIDCRGMKGYIEYSDGTEMLIMMQHA